MKLTDAERARRTAMMKAQMADPKYRARLLARAKAWERSEEYCQNMNAIGRGKPLSKEHVAAIKAGKARRKASKESK